MDLVGPRPQPLGVLPWPAGMLLLPDLPESVDVAARIIAGETPDDWPESLRFYQLALDGQPEAAAKAIGGDDPVARYNRAVLVGGPGVWEALAETTEGDLAALVATARFSIGQLDTAPSVAELTGEVAALAGSARAANALEQGDPAAAIAELQAAVAQAAPVSPLLAASLQLTLAQVLTDADDPARAATVADTALRSLPLTADRELRAHLQLSRGLARQALAGDDRGALLAVVGDLNEAAKVFREESHPELFALCNQQLALAYLVMPMSDQGDRLRLGVAVNALRAALRVYTPQTHPAMWASAQTNLANALQYLPSVHQQDNLDEAVQLYEEVLQKRPPNADPLGTARLLSNQGNALGHLGHFTEARERLDAARAIFDECGDTDSVATVNEILASLDAATAAEEAN